jgi:hypothetical protein
MSIETVSNVLSRITSIEQQLQQLSNGSLLSGGVGVSSGSSSTAATGSASSTNFANQLAQAQGSGTTLPAAATLPTANAAPAGAAATDGVLPTAASTLLTSGQQQFASTLAADTGLNPGVVTAWLLAEESGGAAQSRQTAGNNDWLNIGYTDSGTHGAGDGVWSDPVSAANATAAWMQGQDSVSGYGTASPRIQAILQTVGQAPAAQIQALQQSGWASGGYPSLDSLYGQVAGAPASGTSLL